MREEEKNHKMNSKLEWTLSHIPFENSVPQLDTILYKLKRLIS